MLEVWDTCFHSTMDQGHRATPRAGPGAGMEADDTTRLQDADPRQDQGELGEPNCLSRASMDLPVRAPPEESPGAPDQLWRGPASKIFFRAKESI